MGGGRNGEVMRKEEGGHHGSGCCLDKNARGRRPLSPAEGGLWAWIYVIILCLDKGKGKTSLLVPEV